MHTFSVCLLRVLLAVGLLLLAGCKGEQSVAPQAAAGTNQMLYIGATVYLDGRGSDPGSGDDLSYRWSIIYAPKGSSAALSDADSPTPSFRADQFGTYLVQLVVNNGERDSQRDLLSVHAHPMSLTVSGEFDHNGTSGDCSDCHDGINATGKPDDHITSSASCDACHDMDVWAPAIRVDHLEVGSDCIACHDNIIATGKAVTHSLSSDACGNCHSTVNWLIFLHRDDDDEEEEEEDDDGSGSGSGGDDFDHASVSSGCADCHNNRVAEGKGRGHILSTDQCEFCHRTSDWRPLRALDHEQILGSCSDCHLLPAGHIVTDAECNSCHRTDAWLPLAGGSPSPNTPFDHSTLPPTAACSGCHDGANAIATTKPANHVITSSDCDSCHNTAAWIPVLDSGGGSPAPFDHSTVPATATCITCHDGANAVATTKPENHVLTDSDCDSCHTTSAWIPVVDTGGGTPAPFDHSTLPATATCVSCHDGANATASTKPANHVLTSSDCDVCHTTSAWIPVVDTGGSGGGGGGGTPTVDPHANVQSGDSCNLCHASASPTATTKPPGHVVTVSECDVCHYLDVWIPLKRVLVTGFTHSSIGAGAACRDCHPPLIQPLGHVATVEDCGACHSVTSWKISP